MQGKNGEQQTAFIFNFHQRLFDTIQQLLFLYLSLNTSWGSLPRK